MTTRNASPQRQAVPGSPGARPTLYRERNRTYEADTCDPLVQAVQRGQLEMKAAARGAYPGWRLGKGDLPGLCSVGFWNAVVPQHWGLALHRNEGIELTFLASGEMPVRAHDTWMQLHHDELLVTRPWQPHQLGDPHIRPGHLVWMILDVGVRHPHQPWRWPPWVVLSAKDLGDLTEVLRQNEQPIWPASEDLRRCFLGISKALESGERASVCSQLAVRINQTLLALLDLFRTQPVARRKHLMSSERSVRQFLAELENALGQPWTLESMAESCGMGVTRFVHHCRAILNCSPMQHLHARRVKRACERLIREPERSITEIGAACGFNSSQYFANAFRRQTGRSPRAYRAAHGLKRPN